MEAASEVCHSCINDGCAENCSCCSCPLCLTCSEATCTMKPDEGITFLLVVLNGQRIDEKEAMLERLT